MRTSSDRGSTTAELVIVFPIVMTIMLLGLQSVVYFHTAQVAASAASQGASVAAGTGSGDGIGVAEAFAVRAGSTPVGRPRLTDDGATVRVAVELSVPTIVPFFPRSVVREADEPRERFVNEADR